MWKLKAQIPGLKKKRERAAGRCRRWPEGLSGLRGNPPTFVVGARALQDGSRSLLPRWRPFVERPFLDPRRLVVTEQFEDFAEEIERARYEHEGVRGAQAERFGGGRGGLHGTAGAGGHAGGPQFLGADGSAAGHRGGDDAARQRDEGLGHFAPVFVRERAEHERGSSPGK